MPVLKSNVIPFVMVDSRTEHAKSLLTATSRAVAQVRDGDNPRSRVSKGRMGMAMRMMKRSVVMATVFLTMIAVAFGMSAAQASAAGSKSVARQAAALKAAQKTAPMAA